ncbi:MAG: hypothetical protein JXR84_01455 [Anaerolineae bacterium]|nr:hypothetical protein [Anaerolineae bacterium]
MTISTLVATAALALGYGLYGEPFGVLIFVALGLLWLVGQRYALQAFAGLGMLGFTIGALHGTLYGVQSGWMLAGITAALVAWNLHHFIQHLRVNERDEADSVDAEERTQAEVRADAEADAEADAKARALERLHLQRLGIVSGLGLLLGALALTVRLTLGFGVIVALGLVAIYGLSRLVHYLRQESD